MRRILPLVLLLATAMSALAATPTISSISPSSCLAGSPQFTLTVNGTLFDNNAVVKWNGSGLTTTFVSSTQLTAIVPAALVATAGTASVTVTNPGPPSKTSTPVTFTINNPVPNISSISPTSTTAGSGAFTLTVNGTNFVSTSKVNWNGSPLTTTFVSSTQLTATVPAANVATAGTASVTVVNPAPGGGTSNAVIFTINPPPPVITSSLTATGQVGVAFSYTITATNNPTSYNATGLPSGLSVNTSTGVISGTPAAGTDAGSPYSVTISATNAGGTGSKTLTLTIKRPPPVITSPTTATGQACVAFSYQITATNSPTSYGASGLPAGLSVNTSTGLISGTPTTPGTYTVTVSATNAGGTGSATVTLTVANASPPSITSLLTATGTVGTAFSYTITASPCATSYSAAGLPPGLTVNTATGVISGTPTTAGTYNVTIGATNSGGTTSATLTITINNPLPTTSSISPTCVTTGSPSFTLTVTGTNFISTSVVNFGNTSLIPTSSSSTQLTVTVAASLVTTAGTVSVTVVNLPPGGGTSNGQTFTIASPPAITSASTATGTVGAAFSYQIIATNSPTGYSASGLPAGLSVSTSTGLISGTPTTAGIYQAIISASNGASPCSGAPQANLIITIGTFAPVGGTQGVAFSYNIPSNTPVTGSPSSYNATGLPGGLSVNTSTGIISGTTTTVGTFFVTISATYGTGANATTGGGTLTLTIGFPPSISSPPNFPGQESDLDTGSSTPPSANAVIIFPNASTGNNFTLIWGSGHGPPPNKPYADHSFGGLSRAPSSDSSNSAPGAMQYNPYDPTTSATPNPSLNVWRGNPSPPNVSSTGQFADPRASWYISDPWPAANYLTNSYWGGPTPQFQPLTWPDSGHNASLPGASPHPTAPPSPPPLGQYPDALAKTAPAPDPNKWVSRLSTLTTGTLASMAELGNVWDPAQRSYTLTNSGGALPDIPASATIDPKGGGGYTLAIGRPEFSAFDKNGMRAWQLLDVFSADSTTASSTAAPRNTTGLVNLNTASRDVLRSLAAGILQNRDTAIQPSSLQNNLYPPMVSKAADQFADAVISSRPLLSTAALSAIRVTPPGGSQPEAFFGNPHQYNNQTPPTELNDAGREELFSKILNLATTRSRNFRVFVTGQSLDKSGNVLSTVTKVYQVFIKPNRDPTTGAIQSQQVVIKYEGSM